MLDNYNPGVIVGRMKAHRRKRKTRYEFELTGTGRATAHGGQVLVDALCRRFGLWERIAAVPGIDALAREDYQIRSKKNE